MTEFVKFEKEEIITIEEKEIKLPIKSNEKPKEAVDEGIPNKNDIPLIKKIIKI